MAIRNLRYEGDEILKKKSRPVEKVDNKIRELVNDMIETMHKYNGIGLAAVQVGILRQVVVIDVYEEGKKPYIIINPEIIESSGTQMVTEGCLSFPNKFAKIERPAQIKIKALNENGKKIIIDATGLLAQAIAHETDHLKGEVFIDKIIPGTLEYVESSEETTDDNKEDNLC